MQLYPEVQKKAQDEILRVVGTGRLPQVADRDSLPYVGAVITETMRLHPSVAVGIPHRMTKDDTYKGEIPRTPPLHYEYKNRARLQ